MAYYRPIRIDELTPWILEQVKKENLISDNQIDAKALATALLNKFDVLGYSQTAV